YMMDRNVCQHFSVQRFRLVDELFRFFYPVPPFAVRLFMQLAEQTSAQMRKFIDDEYIQIMLAQRNGRVQSGRSGSDDDGIMLLHQFSPSFISKYSRYVFGTCSLLGFNGDGSCFPLSTIIFSSIGVMHARTFGVPLTVTLHSKQCPILQYIPLGAPECSCRRNVRIPLAKSADAIVSRSYPVNVFPSN